MQKYDLSKGINIPTKEEAKSYNWWTEYLNARTKGIKAKMVLGYTPEQIMCQFGLDPIQTMMIISNIENGVI